MSPRGHSSASPAQALTPPSAQINSALGSEPQLQHEAVLHQPPCFLQEEPGHVQIPKGICKGLFRDGSPHQDAFAELTFLWPGQQHYARGMLCSRCWLHSASPTAAAWEGFGESWEHVQKLHEALSLKCPFLLPRQGAHLNTRLLLTSFQLLFQAVSVPQDTAGRAFSSGDTVARFLSSCS